MGIPREKPLCPAGEQPVGWDLKEMLHLNRERAKWHQLQAFGKRPTRLKPRTVVLLPWHRLSSRPPAACGGVASPRVGALASAIRWELRVWRGRRAAEVTCAVTYTLKASAACWCNTARPPLGGHASMAAREVPELRH